MRDKMGRSRGERARTNRAIRSERPILGVLTTLTAVLVQAAVGRVAHIELKVGLIKDDNSELSIRVGANVPLNEGLDGGVDVGAAENGRLAVLEVGTLVVPVAGVQGSRVKVGGGAGHQTRSVASAGTGDRASRALPSGVA